MTRIGARNEGFTLLELSTAMFVLTVGISGTLVTFYRGIEHVRFEQESRIAMRCLENEIETLRAMPFDALERAADRPFASQTPEMARLRNAIGAVTVEPAPGLEGTLVQVRVQIRWTGQHGRTIMKSLSTFIAGNP